MEKTIKEWMQSEPPQFEYTENTEYFDILLKKINDKKISFEDAPIFVSVARVDLWIQFYTEAIEHHIKGGTLTREACANLTEIFINHISEWICDPTKKRQRESLQYCQAKLKTLLGSLQMEVVHPQTICSVIPKTLLSDIYSKFAQYLAYNSEQDFIKAVYDDQEIKYIGSVKTNLCSVFSEALRQLKENSSVNFVPTKIVGTLFIKMNNKAIVYANKPINKDIDEFFNDFDPKKYVK
jgi:hypothetical protein